MVTAINRLDRYWADELGCSPEALYRGGITVCAPPHREGPRWMGWMVPLECIVTANAIPGTGVISVTPLLADAIFNYIVPSEHPSTYLPPQGRGLFQFAQQHLPAGTPKLHFILSCDGATFQPAPAVFPIDRLKPHDIHADWFLMHFDGPVFVARNDRGGIASWAAIKCKSPEVWEMAVATEMPYRNRGLARSVVSCATEAALEAGKIPLYLHEITNHASARVCTALGYQFYGYELTCEYGRVAMKRT